MTKYHRQHHGLPSALNYTLSPAETLCPRGDLNPHALYGH